jgi:hypothetical protein
MAEPIKPARGVDLAQVLPVTGVLAALGAALITVCVLYRRGRLPFLEQRVARFEQWSGTPAWASLPALVSGLSLVTAGFGFYWDVAVHIDKGRDQNPFGTPAHWPIVIGLCGLVVAGILAVTLDRDTDGGAAIALPGGLRCSLGGALILLCGSVSLLGFPLDDLWHNVFGQDVTLWSPTHIQMIGGASLTTLSTWVLMEEGRRRGPVTEASTSRTWHAIDVWRNASIAGSFLIGLSTLQDEFDMGVPQFNSIYHPILIALAAGIALTAARVRGGRGAAVQAAVFFLAIRGIWALAIGGIFGLTTPSMPLYLVEALLVEAAAVVVATNRHVRFGVLTGALIGTVGVASEWAYGQLAFPLPWQPVLFPSAYLLALVAGVAGGVIGAATGRALLPESAQRNPAPRLAPALALAAAVAVIGVALPISSHHGQADVTVTATGPHEASLLVKLDPPSLANDVAWFNVTSWQGGDLVAGNGLRITEMDKVGPGTYRSHGPVPVDGDYKTVLRLAHATAQEAVPIYLPEDKAIPAVGVAADPHFVRAFVPDHVILQREQVGGSPALKHSAYAILGFLTLLWIATLSLGLQRLDRSAVRHLRPLVLPPHPFRRTERSFA